MSKEDEAAERVRAALFNGDDVPHPDARLLLAECDRLREALRPFATIGAIFDDVPDQDMLIYRPSGYPHLSIGEGDLRAARAALKGD